MKDILVVAKLKEGKFEKFMDFMRSEQGMNERRKIADFDVDDRHKYKNCICL